MLSPPRARERTEVSGLTLHAPFGRGRDRAQVSGTIGKSVVLPPPSRLKNPGILLLCSPLPQPLIYPLGHKAWQDLPPKS